MITVCPNLVKYVPLSTTTSPVTHTAEVDVNKASKNEIRPVCVEMGSESKIAPIKMRAAKPPTKILGGDTLRA